MQTLIASPAEELSAGENYLDLKRDVSDRLRKSCAAWAPEEFDALVEKVTRTTMKYPRTASERLHVRSA
jgi:hypothetical protein